MSDIATEITAFLEKHADQYKMSFGLEYSSIVDWVAEFVPRARHPLCREYNGPWRRQAGSMEKAVRLAMETTEEWLANPDEAIAYYDKWRETNWRYK